MINGQHWGQDIQSLKHLSTALVRSKLCYAQEAFFSAPKYLLSKIQSIDCRAYEVALGVPSHTSTLGVYKEIDVLPLEEQRELAVSKYLLRCSTLEKVNEPELKVKSKSDYPKRAKSISSLTPIGSYTEDLLKDSNINPLSLAKTSFVNPVPPWERRRATFDIDHTNILKNEQPHVLSYSVKMYLQNNYPNHLKVYTDGSSLDNQESGSAFVIPSLNIEKSYSIGKNRSVFFAELVAIVMALHYLVDLPFDIFRVLFCVDSRSVLQSIECSNNFSSHVIVNEVWHLIHLLSCRGTEVTFCWVPSHCGIYGNELADRSAKKGARMDSSSESLALPYSLNEAFSVLKRVAWSRFKDKQKQSKNLVFCKNNIFSFDQIRGLQYLNINDTYTYKRFISIFFKLKLNAFKTKYVSSVRCPCGHNITSSHILFDCLPLRSYLPDFSKKCLNTIFSNHELAIRTTAALLSSPVGSFL